MKKYGFEKEFFILKGKEFTIVPHNSNIPYDECGYLVEARGLSDFNPLNAAYLLKAEEHRIKTILPKNFKLSKEVTVQLENKIIKEALKFYGKTPFSIEERNLYSLNYKDDDTLNRAGLHVHFSNRKSFIDEKGHERFEHQIIDIPKIIRTLDGEFSDEIKAAQRILGSYELKPWGFEYRSLPASTDPVKVALIIQKYKL